MGGRSRRGTDSTIWKQEMTLKSLPVSMRQGADRMPKIGCEMYVRMYKQAFFLQELVSAMEFNSYICGSAMRLHATVSILLRMQHAVSTMIRSTLLQTMLMPDLLNVCLPFKKLHGVLGLETTRNKHHLPTRDTMPDALLASTS